MTDDLDYALIIRHFDGTSTERDEEVLRRWMSEETQREVLVQRLFEVWLEAKHAGPRWETERALSDFKRRVGEPRHEHRPREPTPELHVTRPRRRVAASGAVARRRWDVGTRAWRLAATLVLVAGLASWWLASRVPAGNVAGPEPMRTYATGTGQRANLSLTDGSHVILGARSSLRVPQRFGAAARDVHLEGEAYFEVTSDSARPFTVQSACCLTRVLGTRFDVRARPEEPAITVAVLSGKVALGRRDDVGAARTLTSMPSVLLVAGDVGRLGREGEATVKHAVDVDRLTGWTTGRIAFADAALPDVLDELERWYDVEFVLGDSSLARRHLTTSLRQESIEQMIDVLVAALEVRVSRAGRTITLHSNRRRS